MAQNLRARLQQVLALLFIVSVLLPTNLHHHLTLAMVESTGSSTRTVMITGANGYLASHIVKDLLASDHTVHACVRDASRTESVDHLVSLPGASERLKLFSTGELADAPEKKPFDQPMSGCDAVFHAATPVRVKFGENDGERDIFQPCVKATKEIIECIERHASTVKCLVLTSSMSAVSPKPEPPIKDESHWSDEVEQKERGNWYGVAKTTQDRMAHDWVKESKENGKIDKNFQFVSICPTMVIGPVLNNGDGWKVGGTMGVLLKWLKGGRSIAPNDSMSFIHVEDCARMHTRALSMPEAGGRYMSLIESMHWNDILSIFKELHPALPEFTPYEGEDKVAATKFNFDKRMSLNVPVRSTREALSDAINYLRGQGALE